MRGIMGNPGVKTAPYFRRVWGGTLRFLLGAIWSIPLAGMTYLLYRYLFVLDASRYAHDAALLGSCLVSDANEGRQQMVGLLLFAAAFLLALALCIYGWRRHILYAFLLTDSRQPVATLKAARIAKRKCTVSLWKTMVVNALTLLPAILLPFLYYVLRCRSVHNLLMSLLLLFSSGMLMDPCPLWITVTLFFCLYIPFIPYRKGRYAAVVNAYER